MDIPPIHCARYRDCHGGALGHILKGKSKTQGELLWVTLCGASPYSWSILQITLSLQKCFLWGGGNVSVSWPNYMSFRVQLLPLTGAWRTSETSRRTAIVRESLSPLSLHQKSGISICDPRLDGTAWLSSLPEHAPLMHLSNTLRSYSSPTGGKVAKLNKFSSAYQLANIQIFYTG